MEYSVQLKSKIVSNLSTSVPNFFNHAQKPNAVLLKLSVALRKIQEVAALKGPPKPEEPQLIDEDGKKLLTLNLLETKEPHADSIEQENEDEDEDEEETISSRFVRVLLLHILKGYEAKSNSVRLRCCQIIALSISCLGEIDEDLYQQLRCSLFERIKDKESSVRIQAATALSRLQSADDEPDPKDGRTITQKLIWILQCDPSAEVRRVVILNLELTPETIPFIIERARDADTINRRIVYSKPLAEITDFRMIPSTERYKLIKWGLTDRDSAVKRAAKKMIATEWIKHTEHNLLEFLERMDIMDGMVDDISEKMLTALLDYQKRSVSLNFDEQYWENLSPESAFLVRVYIKVLVLNEMEDTLDKILPEVTRHAFYIQHYNNLWQQATSETEGEYEFIMTQLLGIAKHLDYADEVGRRKMYSVIREIILTPDLPDEHLAMLVDILFLTSKDEYDFTRIMIEVISDIQEQEINELDEQSNAKRMRLDDSLVKEEMTDEADPQILKVMLAKLKCLNICKYMLERCAESLQDNSTIYGVLNQLLIPAIQSREIVLREEGLHCLGLVCHLDKALALHNIPLFIHCIQNGHDELKKRALMVFFDMIMKYGFDTISTKLEYPRELFEYCLDHENIEIQTLAAEGLAKLMLSRMYKDEETLKLLVLLYFFPTTVDNNKIQQCLSYFFPAYCHSFSENQKSMAKIVMPALTELIETYLDLKEGEKMVSPQLIAEMLCDWTDPRRVVKHQDSTINEIDNTVQGDIAISILTVLYNCPKSNDVLRKSMVHIFSRLYLQELDQETVKKIINNSERVNKERPIIEPAYRNNFQRTIKNLSRLYPEQETVTPTASSSSSSTNNINNTPVKPKKSQRESKKKKVADESSSSSEDEQVNQKNETKEKNDNDNVEANNDNENDNGDDDDDNDDDEGEDDNDSSE
ncbi:unnamed protein product [Cunninghamella echinulata]